MKHRKLLIGTSIGCAVLLAGGALYLGCAASLSKSREASQVSAGRAAEYYADQAAEEKSAAAYHLMALYIAAFSTADALPTGRIRVATIHVQVEVDVIPEITINLETAGDVQGHEIDAEVSFVYSDQDVTNNGE